MRSDSLVSISSSLILPEKKRHLKKTILDCCEIISMLVLDRFLEMKTSEQDMTEGKISKTWAWEVVASTLLVAGDNNLPSILKVAFQVVLVALADLKEAFLVASEVSISDFGGYWLKEKLTKLKFC